MRGARGEDEGREPRGRGRARPTRSRRMKESRQSHSAPWCSLWNTCGCSSSRTPSTCRKKVRWFCCRNSWKLRCVRPWRRAATMGRCLGGESAWWSPVPAPPPREPHLGPGDAPETRQWDCCLCAPWFWATDPIHHPPPPRPGPGPAQRPPLRGGVPRVPAPARSCRACSPGTTRSTGPLGAGAGGAHDCQRWYLSSRRGWATASFRQAMLASATLFSDARESLVSARRVMKR